MEFGWEAAALPFGGTVSCIAILQIEQDHRVARTNAHKVYSIRLKLVPEVGIAFTDTVKILKIVDYRAVEKFSKEECRDESAVAHYQIGRGLYFTRAGFGYGMRVPDLIFER